MSCWSYTKLLLDTVCLNSQMTRSSTRRTCTRSLRLQSRPTVCTVHFPSVFACKLTGKHLYRLKLRAIHRFTSTATAVEDYTSIQEGKLPKGLKQFLSDEIVNKGKGKETLAIVEPKLGELQLLSKLYESVTYSF